MQISYVVSSMLFWGRETYLSLEQECEFLKSKGFGVELWPNVMGGLTVCRYDKRNWERLQAATEGMTVAMHARNDNPTLEQWGEEFECAKILKANIVADLQSLGIPCDQELNGCDFAEKVIKMAENSGVKLCIETGPLDILLELGRRSNSISYCLDTGYVNIDPQHTFEEYVDALADRIGHLHLTDNYGQNDEHISPGLKGGISRKKWTYLLKTLSKYDNHVIGSLEMCPSMPNVLLRQASEFIFEELKWPNCPQGQNTPK